MDLSFPIDAGRRQRSHSQVRVPWNLRPDFTVSDSKLLQPGGPGPRNYILQEQGCPVIPPGTGFPFRRLLQLAGLRWWYLNPPPHGIFTDLVAPVFLLITPRHDPRRQHRFKQYLYCCMRIRCRGNVFTEPLHRNGSVYLLISRSVHSNGSTC
jgi:hypothetical protein